MSIFYYLNKVIPKNSKLICLNSFPEFDDQVRAIIREFKASKQGYKLVILTDSDTKPPEWVLHEKVIICRKLSVRGIWLYMRSKFSFFTHGCFSKIKTVDTQTCINVWHGMPIKKIGNYIDKNHRASFSDFMTVTSNFFVDKVSFAFRMPESKMINTGLPRNDILLMGENLKLKENLGNAKNLIAWLPTYRKSIVGELRLDGTLETNIFNMPDIDIEELNQALIDMGTIVVIKPHPMAMEYHQKDNFHGFSNIKIIDEAWLLNNNTTLYEVLAQTELLITDISSVLIDYLLLERPIICHFPDMSAYKGSRGLTWDFEPTQYGIPIVATQGDLINTLKNSLTDSYSNKNRLLELKEIAHDTKKDFTHHLLNALDIS